MNETKLFGKCTRGNCKSMCPAAETKLRINERLVHVLEKSLQDGCFQVNPNLMVKEYSRPAAGKGDPRPSELRPPNVLVQTVDYLLGSIASRDDINWKDIYEFIFDRLRCVRQDMVIQDIGGSTGIDILEKIVRFHIYAGYWLCTEPFSRFDPKMNNQHTQECLKRLLYLYSEVQGPHDNREEFESVYLLYNLGQSDALMHYYDLEKTLRNAHIIKLCYRTSIEYMLGNYVRCLRLLYSNVCKNYPLLLCSFHRHLTGLQNTALQIMNAGYSSKASKFPVESLVSLHLFTNKDHGTKECKQYGLKISDDGQFVTFLKGTFVNVEKQQKYHLDIIEELITMENLSQILLHKSPT